VKPQYVRDGNPYGKAIAYIESDPLEYVNIDTPDDWQQAEKIFKNRL